MPKSMIFLFDGTANNAADVTDDGVFNRFSNVYAINQLIADRKKTQRNGIQTQITFYLPGVGTKFTVMDHSFLAKTRGLLFGDGIEQLILRAYVNLSANYHVGDEIVLIGFSRGAVAARIFSRLISDFGILSSDMLLNLDPLWRDFVTVSKTKDNTTYFKKIEELRTKFREKYKKDVFHVTTEQPIRFLGVFDTVAGSFDSGIARYLHFRDLHPARGVKHVAHIISMHESRAEFGLQRFKPTMPETTSIREIWLPGVHSDIGGGYKESLISNISLLTMCEFIKRLGGVALDFKNHKATLAEVRTQVRNNNFVVNLEPHLTLEQRRDGLIDVLDEIHPLHWHLLNRRREIFWKDPSGQRKVRYVNRIGTLGREDAVLRQLFNEWLV
jgi:uncharacterized protein (DUF2235 family)